MAEVGKITGIFYLRYTAQHSNGLYSTVTYQIAEVEVLVVWCYPWLLISYMAGMR